MKEKLVNYMKAAFPGIAIQSYEEQRVVADVIAAAKACGKAVATWSATEGVRQVSPTVKTFDDTQDLMPAFALRLKNTVYIMRDVQGWPFERDPVLVRGFRDLLAWAPTEGSVVVVTGPTFSPPSSIEKLIVVVDYTLPDRDALRRIAQGIAESAGRSFDGDENVLWALSGLSTSEAENALALSLIEANKFDAKVIYREKAQAVKKSGLLELVEPDPRGLDAIGGLGNLKTYILDRVRAFSGEATEYGLDAPRGILLVGVPGTGKSLSAKMIPTAFGYIGLRLDIGAMFNSLVGESEKRVREALKLAEAISPCVVWIDEVDKGLAGASGSGANDSGVTKRVFGTIITWMEERRRPVYLIATANDVTNLPPEFLRRWDEIFAVDLPTAVERSAIFDIHLKKRRRDPMLATIEVVEAAKGFSGAEIEKAIVAAMYKSFGERVELTTEHLLATVRGMTPLSVMAKEKVEAIRSWAKNRATMASVPEEEESTVANPVTKRRVAR